MKHLALLLLTLAIITANIASASPRYLGDPAMIIRPVDLMQRVAEGTGAQARVVRVQYAPGPDVVPVPVPEPCSAVLLPLGGAALMWMRRRRPANGQSSENAAE